MKLISITACADTLLFTLDEPFGGDVTLTEEAPLIHAAPVVKATETLHFVGGEASCARFAGEHDRIYGRFLLKNGDAPVEGVCYLTELGEDCGCSDDPYPQPATIKTLSVPYEIGKEFGVLQNRPNVNLPQYVSLREQPGTIPFRFEGVTYYFFEEELEKLEKDIAGYAVNTLIVLNSPHIFGSHEEEDMLETCLHPRYQKDEPVAFISAFNMVTEAGQRVYAAFLAFIAERYARGHGEYGNVFGAVISNEINLQLNWGNTGETPVDEYMEEYTQAMRIAWIAAASRFRNFRIYISLANNWNVTHENPLLLYHGKDCMDLLAANCLRDGNFPWHVAHHPYPESFDQPDFWNDRAATFEFDTARITYKNMEVLEAYLAQPQFLYHGQPRRIIFSEQGFNSGSGPLRDRNERLAAAGYVLSYMKARSMKTVDMMTHHSVVDNPHEFGLNLGIFRYDPAAPHHIGEYKPIAYAVKAMETPLEPLAVMYARQIIGDETFDYYLDPPAVATCRDTSQESNFGNGKGNVKSEGN